MPMRRCLCSFWAALLLGLAQLAAGSPLLRSNAGAIMRPRSAKKESGSADDHSGDERVQRVQLVQPGGAHGGLSVGCGALTYGWIGGG